MMLKLKASFLVLAGITAPLAKAWHCGQPQRSSIIRPSAITKLFMAKDLHRFDYLLHEGGTTQSNPSPPRRRLILAGGDERKAILTSSVTFPSSETATAVEEEVTQQQISNEQDSTTSSTTDAEGADEYDPYADLDSQMNKISQFQEQQAKPTGLEARLKKMDLQDIVATLIIPSIVAFAGLRWAFNKASGRLQENADTTLDSFAAELVYHDGDFEEMKMCYSDYKRRLVWMGPMRKDAMLKRYLEAYAKKKTVSPQAISSLSYVFTLFKLSEAKAAQALVSLCREMGSDKISSAGKLFFFGSRILKSDEGKAALLPIKDMIKATYRDATVAETLVETSQQAMGEAAYRAAVQAGGKNQKTLTIGWEVLGLDKETATRIFDEEAKEGFKTDREAMYGLQTQKYDKKGRRIDESGKPKDGEAEDEDEDEEDKSGETSNVYSCSECGYTLFIAQGREFKFYGSDFKCPECGASKDKFKAGLSDDD